jgi:hypothetical protein
MSARRTRRPTQSPLRILELESRITPSTFTVLHTLNDGSAGSLRWAVGQANSHPGADTIDFVSGVFSTPQTITLNGTQLELSDKTGATSIAGPAAGVTIDGGRASRVFEIDTLVSASLSGLTITRGSARELGGGVFNLGTAFLNDCTVSGNSGGNGGGVYNFGTAILNDCTFSGNSGGTGGGLSNSGTATLTRCTVSGNAVHDNSGSSGGGVNNSGSLAPPSPKPPCLVVLLENSQLETLKEAWLLMAPPWRAELPVKVQLLRVSDDWLRMPPPIYVVPELPVVKPSRTVRPLRVTDLAVAATSNTRERLLPLIVRLRSANPVMVTGCLMSSSPVDSEIVWPSRLGAKLTVSPLWAAAIAARSEPEPLSFMFVTMTVLGTQRSSISSSRGRNAGRAAQDVLRDDGRAERATRLANQWVNDMAQGSVSSRSAVQ